METIHDVPVLLRREIEALMIKPFLDRFEKELGREKTYQIVGSVIKAIAEAQGAECAQLWGGNDVEALGNQNKTWGANDALYGEVVLKDDYRVYTDIKKCAYVDMYERIGMKDLGFMLSCLRDEAFYKGFNSELCMTRTKCLMCGDDCCDFRLDFPKDGE